MLSDLEIAQQAVLTPIEDIANKIQIKKDELELYGKYKAKVDLNKKKQEKQGKLILVTSINPTAAGEGKTTVSIGLADGLNQLDQDAVLALREPSLGPVMGVKGGATGGGYSQVLPMEDINLHFTGDIHAITAANNALSAIIDNHIFQGNELQIDPRKILWKRVLDLNDRALRHTVIGLGGVKQGVPRQDGFDITVASEVMAILCLAKDLQDLKNRLAKITIAFSYQDQPITVADLNAQGVMTVLLKDAFKPNLVQTIEGTPAFVHGGPFANIAHGCNSIQATKAALCFGDYAVTEAGFGADLGAEKFLDIKVPVLEKAPDAIVIVATLRALKMHGELAKDQLHKVDEKALEKGFANLKRHIENMKKYHLPVIVAINEFAQDEKSELELLQALCEKEGVEAVCSSAWTNGGKGAKELAQSVIDLIEQDEAHYQQLYRREDSIEQKINAIAKEIYGATKVVFEPSAQKQLKQINDNGWNNLAICIAKTQYSFSDQANLLGAPQVFELHVKELIPKTGAGFIVALTGSILTMPGLPKKPAALGMDVDENGKTTGLF